MNRPEPARAFACVLFAAAACGCFSHHIETEPIEVKPIHVTVDVNVKVQRELDKFFDFEKDAPANPSSRESKE
jgi:hypothetical protein